MPFGWGVAAAAAITVGGSLLADDNGATGANDAAASASRTQARIAEEQNQRFNTYYGPIEAQLTSDVAPLGGQADQDRAAADAGSAIATASNSAKLAEQRRLQSLGINPASPEATANAASADLATGAMVGGSQNQARIAARDRGIATRAGVLQLGKGMPGTAIQGLGNASQGLTNVGYQANQLHNEQVQGIGSALQPFARPLGNAMQNWWNTPSASASSGGSAAFAGNTYGYSPDTGLSTMYARGGIIRKPTKAIIGEHGKEAVLNPGATAALGEKKINEMNRKGLAINKDRSKRPHRAAAGLPAAYMSMGG